MSYIEIKSKNINGIDSLKMANFGHGQVLKHEFFKQNGMKLKIISHFQFEISTSETSLQYDSYTTLIGK
jgi:hypothetical protein